MLSVVMLRVVMLSVVALYCVVDFINILRLEHSIAK